MTEQQLPQHVQFAGLIAELADKEQYDFSTIFNGLAVASASYLVDYTVDLDGNVDTEELAKATAQFVETVLRANIFASEQVKHIIAARKASN